MFIPLIPKDPTESDLTCRDGEIDFKLTLRDGAFTLARQATLAYTPSLSLTPEGTFPTANIRIALQEGDAEKASFLLNGEITRVDPATAERITQAITEKAAQLLKDLTIDFRRQGLFLLPFRVYTLTVLPDGTATYPSPQAIALPTDFPPHPEITASHIAADCLTLALRFPVRPHRLTVTPSGDFPPDHSLQTFISYPLYIPDPKEISGSIGSVRSATGGNVTGIRFAFLSKSAIKASVAAPEKYHEMVGNEKTGYRISSKMAPQPDYSSYVDLYGYVPPFPAESLSINGTDADEDDPLDWIADWVKSGEGYLPASLPYLYRNPDSSEPSIDETIFPDGIAKETILALMETNGMAFFLLTRPMALTKDSRSRRNAAPTSIHTMRIHGLTGNPCLAILYGSDDCSNWEGIRIFDPHSQHLMLCPPRLWWRIALLYRDEGGSKAIFLE